MRLAFLRRIDALVLLAFFQCRRCESITLQTELIACEETSAATLLSFSQHWASLGPFRIGTREALWGADPLEAYGGFAHLPVDHGSIFRSSLTANATVQWSIEVHETSTDPENGPTLHLKSKYPGIDWVAQQRVYGWSALQYQAWTRGYLFNHGPCIQQVLLQMPGILEFYVNGEHIFGADFYGFNRAPILVRLRPGRNKLDIRLIRDVRASGGASPPSIETDVQCSLVTGEILSDVTKIVAPDLVDGRLPSHYVGIPVTNLLRHSILVTDCIRTSAQQRLKLSHPEPIRVIPGQTRMIPYTINDTRVSPHVKASICYSLELEGNKAALRRHIVLFELKSRALYEAHKFTFLHQSGTVSYAVIKPPQSHDSQAHSKPLMLLLHGAGLEADSHQVRHSLDEMPDLEAFALFPTGMSPWSADDWHVWGHADVVAAIDAVHDWVKLTEWNGTSVTTEQMLVAGHSNGGQGTWFFASHMPDRTLAAAPISGYSSIENYVPYSFWTEADPLKSAIVSIALASYKHELFLDNLVDIPLLQQHGSADDNVPPYHSRLMSSLRAKVGNDSHYTELLNKGHWFDGAITTKPLQEFYRAHLSTAFRQRNISHSFSIVSAATDETDTKNGILIEQLHSPDRLGRLHVDVDTERPTRWRIHTSNIRRFRLVRTSLLHVTPTSIKIRPFDTELELPLDFAQACFLHNAVGQWLLQVCSAKFEERTSRQRGSLDAIMRTRGPFQIVAGEQTTALALQISRNMLQYFGGDSMIRNHQERPLALHSKGNVITLSLAKGSAVPPSSFPTFPISFTENGIRLCTRSSLCQMLPYDRVAGAMILRPLPHERLETLVWGADLVGLQTAARLLPSLTGAGQPDFVILGPSSRWQGVQGAIALGFFDYSWNISQASFV